MDPRQELYAALVGQLKNIPEVKHVDLWNENVVYADQDEPWQRPAVFIELGVIDWSENAPIEAWQLTDKIWQALEGIRSKSFDGYYPRQTLSNGSHEELYENIDVFRVKYLKSWSTAR